MDSCAYVIFHSYQCTQTLSFTFRAAKGHVPSPLFDTVTSLSPQRWCAQRHPFRWCRCSSSSQPSSSVTSDTSDPSAPSWPLCPASSSSSQVGAITHVPLSLVPDSVTDHRCLVCPVSHVDTRGHTLHHGTISSVWGRCVCVHCYPERRFSLTSQLGPGFSLSAFEYDWKKCGKTIFNEHLFFSTGFSGTSVICHVEQQVAAMLPEQRLSGAKLELLFSKGCFAWYVWGGSNAAELRGASNTVWYDGSHLPLRRLADKGCSRIIGLM